MIRGLTTAAVLVGGFTWVASAQTPTPAAPPSGTAAQSAPPAGRGGGRGQLVSPQVNPDKTFTLRFRAPNAKEVTVVVELDGKPHPLRIGQDGQCTAHI